MSDKTRQKYYDQLCDMGMPELISASMAAQADEPIRFWGLSLADEIYSFAVWAKTKEGQDFWSDLIGCLT